MAARGDVRRAKLYYLRKRVGRSARVRERRWTGAREVVEEGAMPADDAPRPGEEELAEQVVSEEAEAGEAPDAEAAAAPDAEPGDTQDGEPVAAADAAEDATATTDDSGDDADADAPEPTDESRD